MTKNLAIFYIKNYKTDKTEQLKLFSTGKEALEYFYDRVTAEFKEIIWEIKPDYLPNVDEEDMDGMQVTSLLDGVRYRVRFLKQEEVALYELLTENNLIIY